MRLVILAAVVGVSASCAVFETVPRNQRRAEQALQAMGGPRAPGVWTTRVYEGEVTVEGHDKARHEQRTTPTRLVVTNGPPDELRRGLAEWSIWWDGTGGRPSTLTIADARGLVARDDGKAVWRRLSREDTEWALFLLEDLDARVVLESSHWVSPGKSDGDRRLVYHAGTLRAAELAYTHPRLGDVVNRVEYGDDGGVRVTIHRPDDSCWLDLRPVSENRAPGPPPDLTSLGAGIEPNSNETP